MNDNKRNVPKIRFPGFTDEWERRKLGDMIFKMYGGASIAPDDYRDDGVATVPKGAVNASGIADLSGSKYVEEAFYNKNSNASVYQNELVTSLRDLVPTAPNMGRIVKLKGSNEKYLMPQGVYRLIINSDVDENYLISFSNTDKFRKIISREKNGSTQVHLRNSEYLGIPIARPSKEEQQRIGSFFAQLDNLISLHQRKLENVKELKTGLLQKMFPKNGEIYPEIRFPGFTDAWEQRKLGEVTDVYDGTHQTPEYKEKGIMFLSVENIHTLQSDKYISEKAFENDFKVRPEKGDVLMTRIGNVGTANVVTSNEPVAYYVSLALLKNKYLNPYFLQASIHSSAMQDEIWKRTLHIAFPKKINKNEIEKVLINVPSIQEQDQIGLFIKNLDHLITLHQRKLEHLKELKKGLLQQMFV